MVQDRAPHQIDGFLGWVVEFGFVGAAHSQGTAMHGSLTLTAPNGDNLNATYDGTEALQMLLTSILALALSLSPGEPARLPSFGTR